MLFFFNRLWPYGERRLIVLLGIGGDVSVLRIPGCAVILPLLLDALGRVSSAGKLSRGP
jgi:hypothetical protein